MAASSTTFYILDFVKDIIFYFLLRTTFANLEANCGRQFKFIDPLSGQSWNLTSDICLLPSLAEYAFLHSMIFSVVVANVVTGAYCFTYRETLAARPKDRIWKILYDLGFLAISPLLPICFQIRLVG